MYLENPSDSSGNGALEGELAYERSGSLPAGMNLVEGESVRRDVVRRLHSAGCAGLAVPGLDHIEVSVGDLQW